MKLKVLAVGQLLPDNSGQAVMIRRLAESSLSKIEMHVIPMNLSDDVSDMGKFRIRKVVKVLLCIGRILVTAHKTRASVLYYCPGGNAKLVILRDILSLAIVRPFFRKTILHFHSPFTEEAYNSLGSVLRPLFRRALFHPDLTIRITTHNPRVGDILHSRKDLVVSNGIPDMYDPQKKARQSDVTTILFVGKVSREKGIWELMDAFAELSPNHRSTRLEVVGSFEDLQTERELVKFVAQNGLDTKVSFFGSLDTEQRNERYYAANIFCMPTYFETFGLTILEAMQFEVPVVSCAVGGVLALVKESINGILIPPRNVGALTAALTKLLGDPELREKMGKAGRELYLCEFTLDKFLQRMEQALTSV